MICLLLLAQIKINLISNEPFLEILCDQSEFMLYVPEGHHQNSQIVTVKVSDRHEHSYKMTKENES